MTAGWVAAATRGRGLTRRLIGADGIRQMVGAATWPEARQHLAGTFYGADLLPDAERSDARRAAVSAAVWQLRVLSGWLPVGTSGLARLFVAPIEIENIEDHLASIAGEDSVPVPVPLGSLAVAWPRVAAATSSEQVRHVLAYSAWGDPGGVDPITVSVGLRVAWARRVVRQLPEAAEWAKGGVAVLVARERFAFEREIAPLTGREIDQLLGHQWRHATTVSELADRLAPSSSWPLVGITAPEELWRAEVAVARRVSAEATLMVSKMRFGRGAVGAFMALLLIDLRLVVAALALVGRSPDPVGVFDELA